MTHEEVIEFQRRREAEQADADAHEAHIAELLEDREDAARAYRTLLWTVQDKGHLPEEFAGELEMLDDRYESMLDHE